MRYKPEEFLLLVCFLYSRILFTFFFLYIHLLIKVIFILGFFIIVHYKFHILTSHCTKKKNTVIVVLMIFLVNKLVIKSYSFQLTFYIFLELAPNPLAFDYHVLYKWLKSCLQICVSVTDEY